MQNPTILSVVSALTVLAAGCNPVSMAAKVGMYAVGKVVDDADTAKLAQELIGQPPSAADAALGARVDVFRDVNGPRQWITYPVKLDPLNTQRYVVEVMDNQIVRIEKVHQDTGGLELARAVAYDAMVKGKGPRECEQKLAAGPPELTVRSEMTGQLMQLYNGQMIEGLGDQKYIILRFGADGLCQKLQIVDVSASKTTPG